MSGKIIMGGFSIGNHLDVPLRVIDIIETVDIIAVEWLDPFLNYFSMINKKPKKLIEYNGLLPNYKQLTEELVSEAIAGKTIMLLVDGGMPCVSDPGNELSILTKQNNIKITVIPGPSIVSAALTVSGLYSHRFMLEPEIPEFSKDRVILFNFYKNLPHTIVFIANRNSEASRYLGGQLNKTFLHETLSDMIDIFGKNRPISLCFDLTTDKEVIINGTLEECFNWSKNNINNGMLTIVVEGNQEIKVV